MPKKQRSKTSRDKLPRIPHEFCKTELEQPLYAKINAQKASQYRDVLEPLIGKDKVEFQSAKWTCQSYTIDHGRYIRILMEDVQITKVPAGCNMGTMPVLDHIFIVTDKNWVKRNKPNEGDILKCKGYVHEYYAHTQHRKNIGIQTTEIQIKRAGSRPPHAHKHSPQKEQTTKQRTKQKRE